MPKSKKTEEELKESRLPKPPYKNNYLQMATDSESTQKYIRMSMALMKLPPIDLYDPDAVEKRIDEYFEICCDADMKPTVTGFAMALGMDRRRLWEIKTGNYSHPGSQMRNLPKATVDFVQKGYVFLENLWENYMANGKINPVSGIFLAKNHFGYQDKVDYIVSPGGKNEDEFTAEDIASQYLTDGSGSDDIELK